MEPIINDDHDSNAQFFIQPEIGLSYLRSNFIDIEIEPMKGVSVESPVQIAQLPDMIDLEAALCYLREDARRRNQRNEGEVPGNILGDIFPAWIDGRNTAFR